MPLLDKTMSQVSCFNNGLQNSNLAMSLLKMKNDQRSGRPVASTSVQNVNRIRQTIENDQRQTIHDVAKATELSFGTC